MPKSKEFISDSESDSGAEERPRKKPKTETMAEAKESKSTKSSGTSSDAATKNSNNGETMFSLGKKKFVTVSEFRGTKFVNIREYYDAEGVLKPGKKGIALSMEQWNKLKESIGSIDSAVDEL